MDYFYHALNILVSNFTPGKSSFRIFAFFAYLFVFFLVFIFFKKTKKVFKFNLKKTLLSLVFVFVIIQSINVFVFIDIAKTFRVPLNGSFVLGDSGEITNLRISHLHTGKSVLAIILQNSKEKVLENYDNGFPLLKYINHTVIYLILFLILVYLALNIALLNKISSFKDSIIFTILSFVVLNSFFDGGIFDTITIPSFLLLLILFKKDLRKKYIYTFLTLVLSFIIQFILFQAQTTTLNEFTHRTISILSITFFSLIFVEIRHGNNKRFVLYMTAFFLMFSYLHSQRYEVKYKYGNTYIENKQVFVSTYKKIEKESDLKELAKIGNLYVYSFVSKEKTISDIVKKIDTNINFYPISSPYVTCLAKSNTGSFNIDVISKDDLEETSSDVSSLKINGKEKIGDYFVYNTKYIVKPCTPRSLNIVDESLRKSITSYILTNYQQDDSF